LRHSLGLELEEPPFIAEGQKLRLESGLVAALEPKLLFPGHGVVGIENTHAVTEAGLKAITRSPKEVIVV
jgi:Xaa-Pro aminopeptidase